jgi:hypothetical protein
VINKKKATAVPNDEKEVKDVVEEQLKIEENHIEKKTVILLQ